MAEVEVKDVLQFELRQVQHFVLTQNRDCFRGQFEAPGDLFALFLERLRIVHPDRAFGQQQAACEIRLG